MAKRRPAKKKTSKVSKETSTRKAKIKKKQTAASIIHFSMTRNWQVMNLFPLRLAAQTRYLNYSLSVITSRALPDVRDGLKPVQRRILIYDSSTRARFIILNTARVPRSSATRWPITIRTATVQSTTRSFACRNLFVAYATN